MKKPNHFTKVISLLSELHKTYPTYNMGRHLATALEGYGDIWGMTDRELLFALSKYKAELELDIPHSSDAEIEQIINQGMSLDDIFDEEEEY